VRGAAKQICPPPDALLSCLLCCLDVVSCLPDHQRESQSAADAGGWHTTGTTSSRSTTVSVLQVELVAMSDFCNFQRILWPQSSHFLLQVSAERNSFGEGGGLESSVARGLGECLYACCSSADQDAAPGAPSALTRGMHLRG
jgi:hypothetical protein